MTKYTLEQWARQCFGKSPNWCLMIWGKTYMLRDGEEPPLCDICGREVRE